MNNLLFAYTSVTIILVIPVIYIHPLIIYYTSFSNSLQYSMQEGISINKGLLTLGNVISALGDPKRQSKGHGHIPYRYEAVYHLLPII